MLPNLYALLSATSAVTAVVGDRIYGHGEAPQDTTRPYVTFFDVTDQPFDQISGPPCADRDSVQIDCWHQNKAGIRALSIAVRDALDGAGHANRVVVDTRESATKLYRIAFQADFISDR